jgi:hypothetical protein
MAKKKFDTNGVFDQFFTPVTQETQKTQETQITQEKEPEVASAPVKKQSPTPAAKPKKGTIGRPKTRGETYRFSLYLDLELEKYVRYAVWRDRKDSFTTYFNELVRKDMQRHLDNGGKKEDWEGF